jgi:hypothetical protein
VLLPFEGEYRFGAEGVGQAVSIVKLQIADQEPEPQEFDACMRQ